MKNLSDMYEAVLAQPEGSAERSAALLEYREEKARRNALPIVANSPVLMYRRDCGRIVAAVHVFCARAAGYYAFGLNPESAEREFKYAGGKVADLRGGKKGGMFRLPANAIRYGIDGMGSVSWEVPTGQEAGDSEDLVWSKSDGWRMKVEHVDIPLVNGAKITKITTL